MDARRSGIRWRSLTRRAPVVLLLLFVLGSLASAASVPPRVRVVSGRVALIPLAPGIQVAPEALDRAARLVRTAGGLEVIIQHPGQVEVPLRLWGRLPLRPLVVDVLPGLQLVPGGQSIGVMIASEGLIIRQTRPVLSLQGHWASPAQRAGLQPGDILAAADGRPLLRPEQLQSLLQEAGAAGRPVRLRVLRGGDAFETQLHPVAVRQPSASDADQRTGAGSATAGRNGPVARRGAGGNWFEAGLVVQFPVAGVGTLTFWDPASRIYGALGHLVVDASRQPLRLENGRILRASIAGVQTGMGGTPGEKVGVFGNGALRPLGNIERNTPVGIFGRLLEPPPTRADAPDRPVPVALGSEVRVGPAEILTVMHGEEVRLYGVEILHVRPAGVPESQRLVIRVTDPRLLAQAGGIVQGMSGSPILQDGRLVGAVTHVAVQDPARGFGVLIERMVEASGLWGTEARGNEVAAERQLAAVSGEGDCRGDGNNGTAYPLPGFRLGLAAIGGSRWSPCGLCLVWTPIGLPSGCEPPWTRRADLRGSGSPAPPPSSNGTFLTTPPMSLRSI